MICIDCFPDYFPPLLLDASMCVVKLLQMDLECGDTFDLQHHSSSQLPWLPVAAHIRFMSVLQATSWSASYRQLAGSTPMSPCYTLSAERHPENLFLWAWESILFSYLVPQWWNNCQGQTSPSKSSWRHSSSENSLLTAPTSPPIILSYSPPLSLSPVYVYSLPLYCSTVFICSTCNRLIRTVMQCNYKTVCNSKTVWRTETWGGPYIWHQLACNWRERSLLECQSVLGLSTCFMVLFHLWWIHIEQTNTYILDSNVISCMQTMWWVVSCQYLN